MNDDELGRRVREAWVEWAKEQPDPKPSWLVPYDELSEADKDADRRIGSALWREGYRACLGGIDERGVGYIVSLLEQQRGKWRTRCDDAASHDAIARRDRATAQIEAIDALIAALSGDRP